MSIKYTKWPYVKYTSIFHSKNLQNLPKLGYLVWKLTIWQPWERLQLCCKSVFTAPMYAAHAVHAVQLQRRCSCTCSCSPAFTTPTPHSPSKSKRESSLALLRGNRERAKNLL
jgi:hypothetical protein